MGGRRKGYGESFMTAILGKNVSSKLCLLTDKVVDGNEDHNERGQIETEHLAELEYLATHVSQHPFHRVEPRISTLCLRFYNFLSRSGSVYPNDPLIQGLPHEQRNKSTHQKPSPNMQKIATKISAMARWNTRVYKWLDRCLRFLRMLIIIQPLLTIVTMAMTMRKVALQKAAVVRLGAWSRQVIFNSFAGNGMDMLRKPSSSHSSVESTWENHRRVVQS